MLFRSEELSRCSGKLQDIEANVGNIGTALKEIAEGTVEQTEDLRYFAENGRAVGRGNKSFGKGADGHPKRGRQH